MLERTLNTTTLRRKITESLRGIESLTYVTEDSEKLEALLEQVQTMQKDFSSSLPSTPEGLLLRPCSLSESARRVKNKYIKLRQRTQHYSSLKATSKRGKKRQDSKFRNRVGKKADKLRKVSIQHYSLNPTGLMDIFRRL